ncbi:aspartyl-phosphate phosphatase Spo0E family protein [Paenibacillus polymyxa]|uniref:aspartyl-phosphate phosphatase Spo0E family protein n=1 Tax=Paenibacillus polymyxa TaxID=1406 RepID=UPI001118904D|nr:aspartyl-phosphate phosphatase Spo0E family protein [Paenibacillus polymyxa]QDA30256.1 aspartyl-phosphate phosphatase Spo0E family protein [Paenibacillus polymyxa]
MSNEDLIQKMERERREMHELAERYGLQHQCVISKSMQLDQTLNTFLRTKTEKEPSV